jgi:hypothetical protein
LALPAAGFAGILYLAPLCLITHTEINYENGRAP